MGIGDTIIAWVRSFGSSPEDAELLEGLSISDEIPLDLARAALLIDLALIDARFDAREYEFVMNTLKADLGISEEEVQTLVKSASSFIQFRGSHSFAVEIQKRLPLQQREKIAKELKQLIAADEKEDGFELYLDKKLRDLLGVDGK